MNSENKQLTIEYVRCDNVIQLQLGSVSGLGDSDWFNA